MIGHMHFLGVPLQAFAGELARDHAEAEGFGQWTGVVEPGEGLVLALDGVEELRVVVDAVELIFVNTLQDGFGIESRHFAMG